MTKINYYSWASENLSDSRARAFKNALSEIDQEKFSPEWMEARAEAERIERQHNIAHKAEIDGINSTADQEVKAIQAQIAELHAKIDSIRESRDEAVMAIRTAVYSTAEYLQADDLARSLWKRDDEAVEPKRQALMAKYATAQAKASA